MSERVSIRQRRWLRRGAPFFVVLMLGLGTWSDPNFWLTADQRAQRLIRKQKFEEAAQTGAGPWWIATARYRNGDFEEAAKLFARVPGADGAFNQGNAWLMHGSYSEAVASYDRALSQHPGWKEAEENKALALARQAMIDAAGEDRGPQEDPSYTPDDIAFDLKGKNEGGGNEPVSAEESSEAAWRAQWLRNVQTTPGDFLRAKFAHQAASATKETKKEQ